MVDKAKLNEEQKQKLKKYAVFALMAIVFIGSMWLIFSPSEDDKAKAQVGLGFNTNIPDPKQDEIIGDKKDAYEQAQRLQNKNERMQSLQDYTDLLGAKNNVVTDDLNLIKNNTSKQNNNVNQNHSTIGNSDRIVLLINARERILGGSSVNLFHVQVGVGIKFIIN